VLDTERRERVVHSIHQRSGRADCTGFAAPFGAERIVRARRYFGIDVERRQIVGARQRVIHHAPRQQLAAISHTYKAIETLEQAYNWETDDWRDLYAIVGPGRRLDPASEAELRKALSRARGSGRSLASLSGVMMAYVKSLNLSFSPDDIARIANARHVPLTGVKRTLSERNSTNTICSPIGAVPATYGQAQFSYLPSEAGDLVKAIPDFSGGAP